MHPPCTLPSTTPSARVHAAEKRGKESSDEDGGSDKGSGKEEEEKAAAPDGSSGDDDYRQVKSKRQKLKEKKKRQKAKKAEAALQPALLLPDETERDRLRLLDDLQPTPEAIDQAIAGLPSAHPMLLRMLMTVESICSSHADVDLSYPDVRTLLRHLALLPFPLTPEVLHVAIRHHCLTV
jgi:hypothetical protein